MKQFKCMKRELGFSEIAWRGVSWFLDPHVTQNNGFFFGISGDPKRPYKTRERSIIPEYTLIVKICTNLLYTQENCDFSSRFDHRTTSNMMGQNTLSFIPFIAHFSSGKETIVHTLSVRLNRPYQIKFCELSGVETRPSFVQFQGWKVDQFLYTFRG